MLPRRGDLQGGGRRHGARCEQHGGRKQILYFVRTSAGTTPWTRSPGNVARRVDGSDKIFYTTGRLTSEMVIKAAQMRIPFLVSRSGLTKMGHEIANKVGITMIGRAAGGKHYLLFTGKHRFRKSVAPTMVA